MCDEKGEILMKFDGTGLKKDIDKYYYTFASIFVKKAIDSLEQEAKNCVMYFYVDYEPTQYIRTYDFLDNTVKSYVDVKKSLNTYHGKVDLLNGVDDGNSIYLDNSMSDVDIRKESWLGFHGNGVSIPITMPSPLSYLMDFYNSKKFKNDAINIAKQIASLNKYTYLKK